MPIDIHVTVELQPSPQLDELLKLIILQLELSHRLKVWQPETKPQEAREKSKGRPPVHKPVHQIMEVPAFSEFTTDQPVQLSKNLYYAESEKGLVMIRYLSGTIYTLWSEIIVACKKKINDNVKPIPSGKGGNKFTALNQFMEYVERGLRKGQAAGSQEDPDADFKPMLQQNTRADYDGNKLEGSLED